MQEGEPVPTAEELGISQDEYDRIVRDLGARGLNVPAATAAAPRPATWPRGASAALGLLAVVAALVIGTVVVRVFASGPGGDPASHYAFLMENGSGPVAYGSCQPIQVAVYPTGGPPDAMDLVREAVRQVRAATGLNVVVTGPFGGAAPNWDFSVAHTTAQDPIVVSWQDAGALARLTGDVVGLGASPTIGTETGGRRYVAGTIALSRQWFARFAADGDRDYEQNAVLHEFGHVFGLAHVRDRTQVMNPSVTSLTHYGPGDLAGLRLLGQGGC